MIQSVIAGTGHYVPERCVTNAQLALQVNSDAQWISTRTGIEQRYYAAADETTSSMGAHAARAALKDANLQPTDLDAIIFATLSPDVAFPGCGVFLQRELGLRDIPALDVRNQCSGYLYALSIAHAWIQTGMYNTILIVGSEIHSAGLDFSPKGRDITVLFGDGAGAVILSAADEASSHRGVLDVRLGADGEGAENLWCEVPGSLHKPHIDVALLRARKQFPQMRGRAVFRHAVTVLQRELTALLETHQLDPNEIILVPHQANMRINEMLGQQLQIPQSQIVHTISQFGNTTAASIPMALDCARKQGLIQPETMIVHAAFGSGFTWGTALVRW